MPADSALQDIPVGQISRNPFQPRKNFSAAELLELEESLKSSGLIQPVTVRPSRAGSGFELIAGERRLRAATNLGWATIPAVVKDMTDREILTLALIENLQRFDLNPVEEAEGYDRLIREFEYTQQTVAAMVGKDRSTVANTIRILNLPASIREMVQDGHLTAGQARPLIGLDDEKRAVALARDIVQHGWSAREVERRVRETPAAPGIAKRGRPKKEDNRPAEVRSIEQRLRKHLQTDVSITLKTGNRGSVTLGFYSAEDLERLVEAMGAQDVQQ
ncbi:MAG: ParB/RepB/Spo0J family partition protein [Gemmatimonadaceae bacterium]